MKTFPDAPTTPVAPETVTPWGPASTRGRPSRLSPNVLALSIIAALVVVAVAASAVFVAVGRDWTPGALAAGGVAPSRTVTISLTEFNVKMSENVLPAGKVTLKITNNGTIQHELVVFKTSVPIAMLPMTGGNLNEDAPGVTDVSDGDNLTPGQSVSRVANLTPGIYIFVCNLPGHLAAGMVQTVTVQ